MPEINTHNPDSYEEALAAAINSVSDVNTVTDEEKSAIGNLPADTSTAIDTETDRATAAEAALQAQISALDAEVLEFADLASFPATGDTDFLYVALDEPNKIYRWNGSAYAAIAGADINDGIFDESATTSAPSQRLTAEKIATAQAAFLKSITNFRISSGEFRYPAGSTTPAGGKHGSQSSTYRLDTGTATALTQLNRGIDLFLCKPNGGKLTFADPFSLIFKAGVRSEQSGAGNQIAFGLSNQVYAADPTSGVGAWIILKDLEIHASVSGSDFDTSENVVIGGADMYEIRNNADGTGLIKRNGITIRTITEGLPVGGAVQAFVNIKNTVDTARCAAIFDDNVWAIPDPF